MVDQRFPDKPRLGIAKIEITFGGDVHNKYADSQSLSSVVVSHSITLVPTKVCARLNT
jgi:hypothetical protein